MNMLGWEMKITFVLLFNVKSVYFSWQSPGGVVLLGGYESGNTSEIVLVTGIHSEQHFDLKYDTRWKIVREHDY